MPLKPECHKKKKDCCKSIKLKVSCDNCDCNSECNCDSNSNDSSHSCDSVPYKPNLVNLQLFKLEFCPGNQCVDCPPNSFPAIVCICPRKKHRKHKSHNSHNSHKRHRRHHKSHKSHHKDC